jgi:hypothetical protein
MAALNLSCKPENDKDLTQIVIRQDYITVYENLTPGSKIAIKDMTWTVNTAFTTRISLPVNGYAEFNGNAFLQNIAVDDLKFIAIINDNAKTNEKNIENDNTYFTYGNCGNMPLGRLTILTGTDNNRYDGTFKFYNGTPASNVSNISGGTYDTTISIIAGI